MQNVKVSSNVSTRNIHKDENLTKKTFKLALPAIMEMMMQTLLGFADMAMVGKLGAAAIAAVGLSDMPMMTAMSAFAAISVGTTALVARAIGADDPKEASNVAKQSLIMSIFLAVIFTGLGLSLANKIVVLMGAQQDVIPLSVSYFKIVSLGLPLMIISMVMSGVLRGAGDTKTPMYINGICNIINIVGNFFLIYESRLVNLSLPLMNKVFVLSIPGAGLGVRGAAIATSASRSLAGLAIIFILISSKTVVNVNFREKFRIDFSTIKRILNVGIPAALEQFAMRLGQLLYFRIVADLGTVMVAAHRITLTAESISYMPGFGFALAATTLVGQYLGAKEPELAEKSGYISVKMGAIVMSICGIFFFIWPDVFLRIFTNDKEILESARWCLRIVAISQPFLAGVMGFSGALRGAGDTRTVLTITFVGIWGVRVVFAYLLASVMGFGLIGAWIAMSIDLIIRGTLFFTRFRRGKWKSVKI